MTVITKENFAQEVLSSKTPAIVDFWAGWCGPCMMLSPIVEELDRELPQYKFCKADVDEQRELAIEYGVESIPTLLLVKNGEVVKRLVGYREKDALRQELEAVL